MGRLDLQGPIEQLDRELADLTLLHEFGRGELALAQCAGQGNEGFRVTRLAPQIATEEDLRVHACGSRPGKLPGRDELRAGAKRRERLDTLTAGSGVGKGRLGVGRLDRKRQGESAHDCGQEHVVEGHMSNQNGKSRVDGVNIPEEVYNVNICRLSFIS
jgi:hypothetical protein